MSPEGGAPDTGSGAPPAANPFAPRSDADVRNPSEFPSAEPEAGFRGDPGGDWLASEPRGAASLVEPEPEWPPDSPELDEAMAERLLGERDAGVFAGAAPGSAGPGGWSDYVGSTRDPQHHGPPSGVVPVVRRRTVGSDGEASASGTGVSVTGLPPEPEHVVRRGRGDPPEPTGRGTKRLTILSSLLAVLFLVALGTLVYGGYKLSLKITGGSADRITNEEAPGFVAPVRPTPVDLFAIVDEDGSVATGILVVGNSAGSGGTAVPLPRELIFPRTESLPPLSLADAVSDGGIDLAQERLGTALGFRVGSAATVPTEAVVELADGEPVVVENPDNLIELDAAGNEVLRYPAGELTLAPEEVADYLAFRGVGEPVPNQALRSQDVWAQLFARNEGRGLEGLPTGDESDLSGSEGFGRAITALLAGDFAFDQLPYEEEAVPEAYFVGWAPSAAGMPDFTVRVVPVPESPAPGVRFPTAILNGTGESSLMTAASRKVVLAGGEVALVGNADSLDVSDTTVSWSNDDAAEQAAAIAEEFGVEARQSGDVPPGATIVVVLGADSVGELSGVPTEEGQ